MEGKPNRTLAVCVFKYFPHGGLERDMLRIALACQAKGYEVHVYTTSWQGDRPEALHLHVHPSRALTNHGQMKEYHAWLMRQLADSPPACVIGFQKMPGLDVYYAADGCYQAKTREQHGPLYRLLPRYHLYRAFEEAVFGRNAQTQILMLSRTQGTLYVQHYGTAASRIHQLPPNVAKDRIAGTEAPALRRTARQALGRKDEDRLLLQLGSDFRRKGLDRSILALASLPPSLLARTWLYVVGDSPARPFARLARRLGVADHIAFLGPRDDIPQLLVAADLLVHPAYRENTGTVLLEALASGLPVIATGVCGYAPYIAQAQAGWVIPEPFDQSPFDHTVRTALERTDLAEVGRRGADFARREDLYGMVQASVAVIEAVASRTTM